MRFCIAFFAPFAVIGSAPDASDDITSIAMASSVVAGSEPLPGVSAIAETTLGGETSQYTSSLVLGVLRPLPECAPAWQKEIILWFAKAIRAMRGNELDLFVQFVTGVRGYPIIYDPTDPLNRRWLVVTIESTEPTGDALPSHSGPLGSLLMPRYSSQSLLLAKLLEAIRHIRA